MTIEDLKNARNKLESELESKLLTNPEIIKHMDNIQVLDNLISYKEEVIALRKEVKEINRTQTVVYKKESGWKYLLPTCAILATAGLLLSSLLWDWGWGANTLITIGGIFLIGSSFEVLD